MNEVAAGELYAVRKKHTTGPHASHMPTDMLLVLRWEPEHEVFVVYEPNAQPGRQQTWSVTPYDLEKFYERVTEAQQ